MLTTDDLDPARAKDQSNAQIDPARAKDIDSVGVRVEINPQPENDQTNTVQTGTGASIDTDS